MLVTWSPFFFIFFETAGTYLVNVNFRVSVNGNLFFLLFMTDLAPLAVLHR